MAYAYFKADGTTLAISRNEIEYQDSSVIVAELPDLLNANLIYLDLETYKVKARQPFPIEVSYNLISNVPARTSVTFNDEVLTVDDSSIEFEADTPERLILFLYHPHFIEQCIEVQTGPEAV